MAKTIAKVWGTALVPGVSRNGRLYTADMIAAAVADAQPRLATGQGMAFREREMDAHPMAQRTHHESADDSTRIVGRVARLWLDKKTGAARFEAHLADTDHGRTIAQLVDTSDGQEPFLRGVSIRGAWTGDEVTVPHQGRMVTTSDGVSIDGLDYTHKPGVPGAQIDRTEWTAEGRPRETRPDGRAVIYESVQEARVDAVEETTPAPAAAGEVVHADPGWSGSKRYPLGSLTEAVAAWAAITTGPEVADYSARQLKRMRGRVAKALTESGISTTPEGHLVRVIEHYGDYPALAGWDRDGGAGSVYVSVRNGALNITVSSDQIDPHDLQLVARRAMDGAIRAHASLDPDNDPLAAAAPLDDGPDDDEMESGGKGKFVPFAKGHRPGQPPPGDPDGGDDDPDDEDPRESAPGSTTAVTETGTAPTTQEDPAVTDPQNPPAAPGAITLSANQFAELLAAAKTGAPAAAPVETAPAAGAGAPVEESIDEKIRKGIAAGLAAAGVKLPVEETAEDRQARLIDEGIRTALAGIGRSGVIPRKGLVESTTGVIGQGSVVQAPGVGAAPTMPGFDKPLHLMSTAEYDATVGVALERYVMGNRSIYAAQG